MFAYILHDVCMKGAHISVQWHNIGSMCMTALPTQISLSTMSGAGQDIDLIPAIWCIMLLLLKDDSRLKLEYYLL